ncbi:MAG: hypothetical protein GIX01_09775 [Candidatus Eremiobacteraeota bacterium]|nr:hypothetical protein [Candidatus Eremiobacteraeota bacterium]
MLPSGPALTYEVGPGILYEYSFGLDSTTPACAVDVQQTAAVIPTVAIQRARVGVNRRVAIALKVFPPGTPEPLREGYAVREWSALTGASSGIGFKPATFRG